jgi:hypothetical protein
MGGTTRTGTTLMIGLALVTAMTTATMTTATTTTATLEEETTSSPATTSTTLPEPRVAVVDWEEAARTSAEGLDIDIAPVRLTYLVPSLRWSVHPEGWAVTVSAGDQPVTGITFERPLAIYADRCVWDDPDGLIVLGPSVDDLVEALVSNPEYAATNVREIAVDGYAGKEVDMIGTPLGLSTSRCSVGGILGSSFAHHRPWAGRYGMGPGELNRLRVFDVDGERVVMRAVWHPTTSNQILAELWSIFESLRIERLP